VVAIVRSGGKQYRVEEGSLIEVPSLAGEPGAKVTLDDVLQLTDGDEVKATDGAKVTAEIVGQIKGVKIRVFRYKNKTRSRKLTGSRQRRTVLRVTKIEG
jgi:large subunit ribosomal protein L21